MTPHEWWAMWFSRLWPYLADHLWQATVFTTIILIALIVLEHTATRLRYAVLLLASAKFLIPSTLLALMTLRLGIKPSLFLKPLFRQSPQTIRLLAHLTEPPYQHTGATLASAHSVNPHHEIICLLATVWLLGFLTIIGLWWKRVRQFSKIIESGREVTEGNEAEILRKMCPLIGVRRPIRLVVSSQITEPGVWRVRRPVLVLPENIADELSEFELETVIMHELIHVARRDNLISNLHMVLCSLLWFHPLIWLIDRKLLAERERVCDEEVIRLGGAATVYAASILKVYRFSIICHVPGVSGMSRSNLERRIQRIRHADVNRRGGWGQHLVLSGIAVAVIIFSVIFGFVHQISVQAERNSLLNLFSTLSNQYQTSEREAYARWKRDVLPMTADMSKPYTYLAVTTNRLTPDRAFINVAVAAPDLYYYAVIQPLRVELTPEKKMNSNKIGEATTILLKEDTANDTSSEERFTSSSLEINADAETNAVEINFMKKGEEPSMTLVVELKDIPSTGRLTSVSD